MGFFNKLKKSFDVSDDVTKVVNDSTVDALSEIITEDNSDEVIDDVVDENLNNEKYSLGLKKSGSTLSKKLNMLFNNLSDMDEEFFEDLEEMLITSDFGVQISLNLVDEFKTNARKKGVKTKEELKDLLVETFVEMYGEGDTNLNMQSDLTVVYLIGVNGAGKTTTIGKLASKYKSDGKKVLLAAGDTFRAGAVEQLGEWASRTGVDIVKGVENQDPSSVMFKAVDKAKRENYDIILCDTSGRLQNKVNLMKELEKMVNVASKIIPSAPHEVLLVVDSSMGQNAMNQAKLFNESTKLTGLVLTKLDGTGKGGIVYSIKRELDVPVKFIGLGEGIDALKEFNLENFAYNMFKGLFDNE